MAISGLSEAQLKASELLASGESQVKTAKIVNVNPKTIQRWLKDDMFKAEVERNVRLLKSKVDENILMNIEPIMKRLINIALNSDSEKTSLDACIYAVNRIAGTPTNKVQDVTDTKESNTDIDIDKEVDDLVLDEDIDTNIINLEDKKAQ